MPELSSYVDMFYSNLPLHAGIWPAVAMVVAAILHPALLTLVTLAILAVFAYVALHIGHFGLPITVNGQPLEVNATLIEMGLAALATVIFFFILRSIFKAMARASA